MSIPTLIMAGSVSYLNMRNIKRSPQYNSPLVATDMIRFAGLCIIKGSIYGFFWPFSLAGILVDLPDKKRFDRHFIPFSNSKQ